MVIDSKRESANFILSARLDDYAHPSHINKPTSTYIYMYIYIYIYIYAKTICTHTHVDMLTHTFIFIIFTQHLDSGRI